MSDFARFWRLLVLVQQPLAVISPRGREGDNMLPVIFFVQSKQQIFSPGSLWLSLLLIRGVRHVGEGGGGSWESNYFSLFLPQTFFFFSTRVLGAEGEKVDELQRCGQGHRIRMNQNNEDVRLQKATAFVGCLFCCFLRNKKTTFRETHL